MRELKYPFNADEIIRRKKSYRRRLLEEGGDSFIEKKIAILGGATTSDIKLILELFLLDQGIRPVFYESEYNRYYEDGRFPNPELVEFHPDLIYVCTCIHNIPEFPEPGDSTETVDQKFSSCMDHFTGLWDNLLATYECPVIQNNFEYPSFRLLGNMDAWDHRGRVNYVTRLNCGFYDYAEKHGPFYICDINYLSSDYGLSRWSDPLYWHMYKYAVAVPAIPYLAFNVANIIKAVYGKNKKVLNLDLDNTLWGGVIGDDGAENIEIGQENATAQTYSEFQEYLRLHKQLGVLLTVNSKNDESVAKSGFDRPDSVLKTEDFVSFKADWEPKSMNLTETSSELSLLPESFVFVDDNPAEREIVRQQIPGVAVPEMGEPSGYIRVIDRSGFFECIGLSDDDLSRNRMYMENAKRQQLKMSFSDYEDYLKSLEMKAEIRPFSPVYMSRIAQLTNKSNQFNLTTKRYSQSEIEQAASDRDHLTLYGRLEDRFGDNGVVSVVIGRISGENRDELHIELWLMSCRVLKRKMENAMMDTLIDQAGQKGIRRIFGYYYPTAKNGMVKDFYSEMGFTLVSEDSSGNRTWEYAIKEACEKTQAVIEIQ
ncbi:MAG: HAD-IIIC family phosphatase [Lachnospiraceae bacterium]|nr:HAD-IIIC family phosphatase [Lachnospiraceae bacterium]